MLIVSPQLAKHSRHIFDLFSAGEIGKQSTAGGRGICVI